MTTRAEIASLGAMTGARMVLLLGPPGVGKSTLGSLACERLGLRFVDLPDDTAADIDALEAALAGADVATLPWHLQSEVAILRAARRLGTTVALWSHPETMQARARQPIVFTGRRGLVTRGGFGRHGTSCLKFRRLDRACDLTLEVGGLSESEAVAELVEAITNVRVASDPTARLDALRADIEDSLRDDTDRAQSRAVKALATAIARYLFHREQAGVSPRSLKAVRSDLHVAAMLVFAYEGASDERILDRFRHGAPCVSEFQRKHTDSAALVARYERNLRAFADFLGDDGAEEG